MTRWRDNLWVQMRCKRIVENRFTFLRTSRAPRFMRDRQRPYEGWRDRREGCYMMNHNTLVKG